MKLLGCTEKYIDKNKNCQSIPHLEIIFGSISSL